jgi:hypothetical protein
MMLGRLYDEKLESIFFNRDDYQNVNDEHALNPRHLFPTLTKPIFCPDDEEILLDTNEKIQKLCVETLSLAIRDLSLVYLKDAVIFLENNNIPMIEENEAITFTLKNRIVEQALNKKANYSLISRVAWWTARREYKKKHMVRKNDKVPKYIEILLKRLEGMSFSELEEKYRNGINDINISVKLQSAWDDCVPIMRNLFPELPPLPRE